MAGFGVPISWEVNVTNLIGGLIALVGFIGAVYQTRGKINDHDKALQKQGEKLDDISKRLEHSEDMLTGFKLQVVEAYTKKEDLRETEQRLVTRMDKIEHEVRQIPMQVVGMLSARGPGQR
ncbi:MULTISPECIES: hypothetical protein [Methylobacterium]|uniref:Uncharacterized protein n=2 Tax=Methylobacterium TaxID=407 RepID=A0A8H9CA32_9HYPH|nr:hypothetical protein [Methylobacterium indicum]BCM87888.1 hypothetical protein mvi_63490 [Methylobacterium indicum]